MIEVEFKNLAITEQRALVYGSTSLSTAIAAELAGRSVSTVLCDAARADEKSIDVNGCAMHNLAATGPMLAQQRLEQARLLNDDVTLLVNVCCPDADRQRESLLSYADDLMSLCSAAAERMAAHGKPGCIINHGMLPAIYAGTPLEDQMSILRGAITGVTRSIARRYGKLGIRCIGIQTGLIDIPECKAWISDKLGKIEVPTKRWGTPGEVAKLVAFLALEGSYITGQTIILDGGLTAGISGT